MKSKIINSCHKLKRGQALVTLLVFSTIAILITSAAVTISLINTQSTSKFTLGQEALSVAESGADNAILQILRKPNLSYLGETLLIGNGIAVVTVSYTLPTINIQSTGTINNFVRKVEVIGSYQDNQFIISSWNQID